MIKPGLKVYAYTSYICLCILHLHIWLIWLYSHAKVYVYIYNCIKAFKLGWNHYLFFLLAVATPLVLLHGRWMVFVPWCRQFLAQALRRNGSNMVTWGELPLFVLDFLKWPLQCLEKEACNRTITTLRWQKIPETQTAKEVSNEGLQSSKIASLWFQHFWIWQVGDLHMSF